jgi:two-component system response regulator LytT
MTDLSGIQLARIIEQTDKKKSLRIIFTTAYDEYAIDGFKVDALDYILKPFNFVDFSRAATKAYDYFVMLENTLSQGSSTIPQSERKILLIPQGRLSVGQDRHR